MRLALVAQILCAAAFVCMMIPNVEIFETITLRMFSVIPLLVGMYLFVEYPPPGNGVGKTAEALPGLQAVMSDKAETVTLPKLGQGGALLKGHCYLIVFFNLSGACIKALPKAEAIAKRLVQAAAAEWFHVLLISRDDVEDIKGIARFLKNRVTPIAHDSTGEASLNYLTRHSAYVVPHAFVVDSKGVIAWHGQINRKGCQEECSKLLKAGVAPEGKPTTSQDSGGKQKTQKKD